MTTFDWLLLMVLSASIGFSVQRGVVYEALSAFFWLLVFYLALLLAPDMASLLALRQGTPKEHFALSFMLVFIVAALIGSLYALSPFNNGAKVLRTGRTMSWFLGLVRGIVLLLAGTVVISMTSFKHKPWWRDSTGAVVLVTTLKDIRPMLPQRVAEKMN
jgi:membrane protein required for colicin V production